MDALKKSIIYCAACLLIFGAGYWCGCRVSDDRAGNDPAGGYIQSAGKQAEAAADALESAGGAIDEAQHTAGDIAEGNRNIEAVNGSIADLIAEGEQILAGIRREGEEGA